MACYTLKFDGVADIIRIPASVETFNLKDFAKDLNALVEKETVSVEVVKEEEKNENTSTSLKVINVYSGTNDYPSLSNFADRPFKFNFSKYGRDIILSFKNVESAFQWFKLNYANKLTDQPQEIQQWAYTANTSDGVTSRIMGRQIQGLKVDEWNKISTDLMRDLMLASFEQNPESIKELLSTGDAVLTHNNENGIPQDVINGESRFAKLLMEIRSELRAKQSIPEIIAQHGYGAVQTTIDTLESDNAELSDKEKKSIKSILGDTHPKVLIASEATDPIFHAEEIKKLVKEELTKSPKDRSFHMMYLITKHDGLPLKELAELKIPKFIHFSITSLGGTKYEPGVMKMDDLLDRIQAFIEQGVLNPNLITIRIDPIIPGVTKKEDIRHIIERGMSMGIKQYKFSVMDSYGYTSTGERSETKQDRFIIKKMSELGYDWDTYYGRRADGTVEFNAKRQYIDDMYQYMDDLAEELHFFVNTCGEEALLSRNYKHIKLAGCVNVDSMNAAFGTSDIVHVEGNQRKNCSCYGNKVDALSYDDTCASSCVYCYAKHNSNKALEYYTPDGTLKRNRFTEVTEKDQSNYAISNTQESSSDIQENSKCKLSDIEYSYKQFISDLHAYKEFIDSKKVGEDQYLISKEDLAYITKDFVEESLEKLSNENSLYNTISTKGIIVSRYKLERIILYEIYMNYGKDKLPKFIQNLYKFINSLSLMCIKKYSKEQLIDNLGFTEEFIQSQEFEDLITTWEQPIDYIYLYGTIYNEIPLLLNQNNTVLWDFWQSDPSQLQFSVDQNTAAKNDTKVDDEIQEDIKPKQTKVINTPSSEIIAKINKYLDISTKDIISKEKPLKEIDKLEALNLIKVYMEQLGVKVHLLSQDSLVNQGFPAETEAAVRNGEIFVNLDRASLSSPIHEFMHLVFAIMKQENFEQFTKLMQELRGIKDFENILTEVQKSQYYNNLIESDQLEEAFVRYLSKIIDGEIETSTEFEQFYIKNQPILSEFIQIAFNVPKISDLLNFLKQPFSSLTKVGSELFVRKNMETSKYSDKKYKIDISGKIMAFIQARMGDLIKEGECK